MYEYSSTPTYEYVHYIGTARCTSRGIYLSTQQKYDVRVSSYSPPPIKQLASDDITVNQCNADRVSAGCVIYCLVYILRCLSVVRVRTYSRSNYCECNGTENVNSWDKQTPATRHPTDAFFFCPHTNLLHLRTRGAGRVGTCVRLFDML